MTGDTDWHSKYQEAKKALRLIKQKHRQQGHKSRQLVAAVKQKLEEKDQELMLVLKFKEFRCVT